MKPDNEIQIPVCESATNDKVIKFINLENFTDVFQHRYNNNQIWGVFYDENNNLVAQDIWDDVHENILK